MNPHEPLILTEQKKFHAGLLASVITVKGGVPSIADKDNCLSVKIASAIIAQIGTSTERDRIAAQTSGDTFEIACAAFLTATFGSLLHFRPGSWTIQRVSRRGDGISGFDQYVHLRDLANLCGTDKALATSIGMDYLICPDIVILRNPELDKVINQSGLVVDHQCSNLTPIRRANSDLPILHASISCKFTLRSDRAQNARSEALNLIKNRKGQTPRIVVVTAEPLPSRLASLAMGTGEIDCIYHFALQELKQAVSQNGHEDSQELLHIMIEGKRLRDIADLPLDLAT